LSGFYPALFFARTLALFILVRDTNQNNCSGCWWR